MIEAHYNWVEMHKIFTIEPKSCRIDSGDFKFVKITYERHSVGTHIYPLVFNVRKGKSVVLYCKAHTIAPNVGKLFVRNNVIALKPVPLGYGGDYRDFFNTFKQQTEPESEDSPL
jgi:hypothetical protein